MVVAAMRLEVSPARLIAGAPFVLVKMFFSAVLNPQSLTLFSVTCAKPQSLEWSDRFSKKKKETTHPTT